MKGVEEFNIYLKEWCEKNHKPCPKENETNKVWYEAWESFVKEELKPEWEERKQEYLNMKLLKNNEVQQNEKVEEETEETEEKSEWEKVKEMLR